MRLSLHYNPSCPDCVRQAKRTAQLDWLRAIELRTDRSPLGEVPVGEIVVVDEQSRRVFTGVYATRIVCLRIPLLFLYGLLLFLPPIRKRVGGGERQVAKVAREPRLGRRVGGAKPGIVRLARSHDVFYVRLTGGCEAPAGVRAVHRASTTSPPP